ncbi:MAG TPA: aspartate aminotransferase family protein [Polyangiaceae bacterium]|nr:aspartate aminotransferase family protein [Polyangiaceae bacterium]
MARSPLLAEQPPLLRGPLPGPRSLELLKSLSAVAAPMGPRPRLEAEPAQPDPRDGATESRIVYASARGVNVQDADGNIYVDLAAGFGSLLLGHSHPAVLAALSEQSQRLMQGLGDVYPSELKLALLQRLTRLYPGSARACLAQSGSDAVTCALKSAALATGRPRILAFQGAYHGLGYGPLAACGLRESYRTPFTEQLNPHVTWLPYPANEREAEASLDVAQRELARSPVGAVLIEPVLGRGGVIVPPATFLPDLGKLAREGGALLIADEVWTGLGRSGHWLFSLDHGVIPDLICLGKGLGGGLPMSAVLGRSEIMQHWSREAEVVHTSTFAGAPLACATAIATLQVLERDELVTRARCVGEGFLSRLRALSTPAVRLSCRGAGLMIGIESERPTEGWGARLQKRLLARGYITSTGGGARDVLVLTPPLGISQAPLDRFVTALEAALSEVTT